MPTDRSNELPTGWEWVRRKSNRLELGRPDGPSLLGERDGRDDRDGWRVVCRAEREEGVYVDRLGEVPEREELRSVLAEAAGYIEERDLPAAHLGELLVVEDGSVRCREWRIE
ncbi:hypothetical protein [Halalkalicoccus tibetensis]|uniref:Uncharacterized protein n=1 Tax=Halalkalicoccus tibetensis TaxID=175632 RepID=A0ABD5V581_9EURY